jgi:hypothetical protein
MQQGQQELTLLTFLQRQRQSDQDWYAQWDNEPVPNERRFRLLRLTAPTTHAMPTLSNSAAAPSP